VETLRKPVPYFATTVSVVGNKPRACLVSWECCGLLSDPLNVLIEGVIPTRGALQPREGSRVQLLRHPVRGRSRSECMWDSRQSYPERL